MPAVISVNDAKLRVKLSTTLEISRITYSEILTLWIWVVGR